MLTEVDFVILENDLCRVVPAMCIGNISHPIGYHNISCYLLMGSWDHLATQQKRRIDCLMTPRILGEARRVVFFVVIIYVSWIQVEYKFSGISVCLLL